MAQPAPHAQTPRVLPPSGGVGAELGAAALRLSTRLGPGLEVGVGFTVDGIHRVEKAELFPDSDGLRVRVTREGSVSMRVLATGALRFPIGPVEVGPGFAFDLVHGDIGLGASLRRRESGGGGTFSIYAFPVTATSLGAGFRRDELAPPGEASVRYRERPGIELVLAIGWSFR